MEWGLRHDACYCHCSTCPSLRIYDDQVTCRRYTSLHACICAVLASDLHKLSCSTRRNTDHAAEDVRPALEATLNDLRTPYLDLYLVRDSTLSGYPCAVVGDPWTKSFLLPLLWSCINRSFSFCMWCIMLNAFACTPVAAVINVDVCVKCCLPCADPLASDRAPEEGRRH